MVRHKEHFDFSRTGVVVDEGVSFDAWKDQVMKLSVTNQGLQFWIGDLLLFGEQRFGEKYEQAQNDFGLAYQTLANMKWVSAKVPLSLRREELTWNHHVAVAKLDPKEQERWLKLAIREKLTATELKAKVQLATQRTASADDEDSEEDEAQEDGAKRYKVIVADLPDWSLQPDEISRTVRVPAEPDAVMFLWAPADKLRVAMILLDLWGFDYQSCGIWDMTKSARKSWFLEQHQLLLVGTRGNIHSPPVERLAPSIIRVKAPKNGGHPEEFWSIIEDAYPMRGKRVFRLDLFGSEVRDGWDAGSALASPVAAQ